mmetsp:Transcript_18282/g.39406  ORF Transcript_18282/g.39406 Transcript_18282/m.39406 type:complete len:333 (+) Transcript_18282:158-1156(+)|eukprot:CAMPEP_0206600066 /NCGR_PEP_ID=MMETSP0325_2-20121206/45549_1 /ASSEMBLY_ACC=CAM_ASM_000347 /TAXON_ID=2866 /ORGANISM="Crypthecodinium cohnii, Strain Seligo" /LENGTH=332 /DNA_ID=CAMNT_0054111249 /DNA_START=94 /DNA_END=1092 /DNA_ORIENTATION=-
MKGDSGDEDDLDLEDDGDGDISDLLDGFARRWQQEFDRLKEAESQLLKHVSEEVDKLAIKGAAAYGESVEERMLAGDSAAHVRSKVTAEVVNAEHAYRFEEVHHSAEQGRNELAAQAMRDSDDLIKSIEAAAERKRLEREAKRKEEKKRRDAEFAARQKARSEAAAKEAGAGFGTGGEGVGGRGSADREGESQGRSKASEPPPPPRFTRKPGEHARATAPIGPTAKKEYTNFADYDSAWREFERGLKSGLFNVTGIKLSDIPWPTKVPSLSGIHTGDAEPDRKKKLKAAVLRWHPDKWSPILELVVETDRKAVVEKAQEVARRILDERSRLS